MRLIIFSTTYSDRANRKHSTYDVNLFFRQNAHDATRYKKILRVSMGHDMRARRWH
jgi:hypothetical protein